MPDSNGPQEATTVHINDNPDSLEIGTPAKGGAIKVYGNFDNPEEFLAKLNNAFMVRRHAQALMEPSDDPAKVEPKAAKADG